MSRQILEILSKLKSLEIHAGKREEKQHLKYRKKLNETDLSSVYLTYETINYAMGYDEPTARPKSSRPKSSRPKTAGRPKTGKKKKSEGEEVVNKKKEDDAQKYPQSRRLLSPKKHFA